MKQKPVSGPENKERRISYAELVLINRNGLYKLSIK
jgi:hypothetical protein